MADVVCRDLPVDAGVAERLEQLGEVAFAADGARPFSEQTLVAARLAARGKASCRVLAVEDAAGHELGMAALLPEGGGYLVEAAVAPAHRGRGAGSALATAVLDALAGAPLVTWIHGGPNPEHPALVAALHLADKHELTAQRELYKMGLELTDDTRARIRAASQQAPLPAELTGATYTDKEGPAWVTANAAAFSTHPEQGKLTLADLTERTASPWFRPEGFFLAHQQDGALAGFHWTKIPTGQGDNPEGEIYAVGITPAWQGKGLGKALTLTGMDYLAHAQADGTPLNRIVLYVDASNTPATTLYRKLGFTNLTVDRQYSSN